MRKLALILLTGLFAMSLRPAPDAEGRKPSHVAWQNGEKLKFTLHYGIVHAGEAVLQVKDDKKIGGKEHYHISATGYSLPFFDKFYKVRDYYDSYVDKQTLLPTVFLRDVWEDDYKTKEYYIFNRNENYVKSEDKKYAVSSNIHDIVSAFYYLRCLDYSDIKAGEEIPVKSFFDKEVFPLGVEYIGKKVIKTKFGKMRCMVFEPKLIEGRIFKDQRDMTLYVSDDKNKIPVRIESAILVGKVKADLIEYSKLKYPLSALVEG